MIVIVILEVIGGFLGFAFWPEVSVTVIARAADYRGNLETVHVFTND